MDEADERPCTYDEGLALAEQLELRVSCFVTHFQTAGTATNFDTFVICLLLKEQTTFGDILLLVKHGRLDGAQARLRSIWESLVVLKYVVHCSVDWNAASMALNLYDEFKRVNIMQGNGVWSTLTEEEKREKQEFFDQFNNLDVDLKSFVKRPVEQMCSEVNKIEPTAFPDIQMGFVLMNQYDAIFRPLSTFVHGGLAGSRAPIERFLGEDCDPVREKANATGILCAATEWLSNIIEFWTDQSTVDEYKTVWTKCKEATQEVVAAKDEAQAV